MKTITKYECEICGRRYRDLDDAQACEDRGPAPSYPIGLIYGHHADTGLYSHITFAVGEKGKPIGHSLRCGRWACRDMPVGDSLGEQLCDSGFLTLTEHYAQIDPSKPHFQRMVTWLESQNIPVTVWDGEKPVPLEPWRKNHLPHL
jgi:hypothetical protein